MIRALAIACALLAACSRAPPEPRRERTAQPRPQPLAAEPSVRPELLARPAPPPPLPVLERERLGYLFDAAALVARTWPQLSPSEVCILLVARSAQWIVQCDRAPPGFRRTEGEFRGRPIHAHTGDAFEVSGTTRTTAELLAQTPAAAHVSGSGFAPNQAWLLLGTLDALRAFHPAFPPAMTEHWLSVAVHELVHVHQLRQPSIAPHLARIDAHELHPDTLTELYENDATFRAAIQREYRQLTAAAASALQPVAARRALQTWLRSYRRRSAELAKRPDGVKLLADERLFTHLEGVARFVESDFLVNEAQHPRAGLSSDPDFHGFGAFLGGGYAVSPNRQLDRQYYYAIGYHLCVLLERVDPEWHRRVDAEPGWLIGLIERLGR